MKTIVNLFDYYKELTKSMFRTVKAVIKYPRTKIASGVSINDKCRFGVNVKIHKNSIIADTHIGDYSYVGGNSEIKNCTIGKFCSIAPDVKIGLGIHPTDKISTYPGFYSDKASVVVHIGIDKSFIETKAVTIGNDVWIGTNCLIKDGVYIGNGAIIAAGSVVTKNVAPYSIVGGIPAKVIRYRFSTDEIELLESFKWWDKGLEFCKKNAHLFLNKNEFFVMIRKSNEEHSKHV